MRYNIAMDSFNWPIVGHTKIQQILQKGLLNNKLAHAYLFSGPAHLGKSLVAEKFIASILCHDYHQQNKSQVKSLPCNECVFCQQYHKGIHPDVYNLKKEEDKKNISVEQVREMQKFLSLTSFLNSYKIAVIENAQDLSESAQNALLKALEEPNQKTILILLVNDANFLLSTISSRCQLIKFRLLAEDNIFDHLISLGSSREKAKIITALAGGQIGLAINYMQNPDLFETYIAKMTQTLDFFNQDLASRFKNIENILGGKKGTDSSSAMSEELDYWQLILRDILFAQNNLENLQANLNFQKTIKSLAEKYSTRKILSLMAQIKQIKKYLTYNINPRLAVENLLINL